jgi:hypothetical protein
MPRGTPGAWRRAAPRSSMSTAWAGARWTAPWRADRSRSGSTTRSSRAPGSGSPRSGSISASEPRDPSGWRFAWRGSPSGRRMRHRGADGLWARSPARSWAAGSRPGSGAIARSGAPRCGAPACPRRWNGARRSADRGRTWRSWIAGRRMEGIRRASRSRFRWGGALPSRSAAVGRRDASERRSRSSSEVFRSRGDGWTTPRVEPSRRCGWASGTNENGGPPERRAAVNTMPRPSAGPWRQRSRISFLESANPWDSSR